MSKWIKFLTAIVIPITIAIILKAVIIKSLSRCGGICGEVMRAEAPFSKPQDSNM